MANRLADASSPYLLQHADNPIDWWPWCPEAFEEARRRDVPVMISVGYAACHWCHVMAHESFEDPVVAELVNERLVAIKVDREERPDVDAVYMAATQAMTGQGGWPMTVFATPDGEPFFCGTYFPRANFVRLVDSVSAAWRDQRDAVVRQGGAVVEAVSGFQGPAGPPAPVSAETLDAAAERLLREFDPVHGGFGGAPKFPPHMNLLFLLRYHQRTGDQGALRAVEDTCAAMARGGIYDQVAGGFARYSVDAEWTVPHFEKMLYDNALLLRVYTQLWRLTGDEFARRIATEVVSFLLDQHGLATTHGFASSLDADTAGVEGATYVWTPEQLRAVLGDDRGAWAADLLGVVPGGNFEHGTSVLRMRRDIDAADPAVREQWRAVREELLRARLRRPQPGRDDKVVAAWNGLAVTALVEYCMVADQHAGGLVSEAGWKALTTAEWLANGHLVEGTLRRVSRDGAVGEPLGVLDDYGCTAEAFCAMHQFTGEARWLDLAGQLLDTVLDHFSDDRGGFYDTADFAEPLVTRPADPTDNATPSGLSAAVAALTTYAALSGRTRYREAAERALGTVATLLGSHPRFVGYALSAAEAQVSGPYEIAVVGGGDLLATAVRLAPPGAVVVAGEPDQPGVPLLAGRPMVNGDATAYVCRGFVCDRPATDREALAAQLAR
ncbi:MAG TPA: thioredoxin domain-containing protein [Micromonosporaceae bacterium]